MENWYTNKTIWGSILTVLSLISYFFGFGPFVSGTDVAVLAELITAALGTVVAGYDQYKKRVAAKSDE